MLPVGRSGVGAITAVRGLVGRWTANPGRSLTESLHAKRTWHSLAIYGGSAGRIPKGFSLPSRARIVLILLPGLGWVREEALQPWQRHAGELTL